MNAVRQNLARTCFQFGFGFAEKASFHSNKGEKRKISLQTFRNHSLETGKFLPGSSLSGGTCMASPSLSLSLPRCCMRVLNSNKKEEGIFSTLTRRTAFGWPSISEPQARAAARPSLSLPPSSHLYFSLAPLCFSQGRQEKHVCREGESACLSLWFLLVWRGIISAVRVKPAFSTLFLPLASRQLQKL